MAGNTILHKIFQSFKGLDLRTSDLLRSEQAATSLTNMDYRQTGAMNKRKGYQNSVVKNSAGGYGLTTFNNTNTTSGIVTEELISVDDNLNKMTTNTFNITYTGSNNSVYYTMSVNSDDNKFYFEVYDDQTRVLNFDCGDGSEVSPALVGTTATANTLVKAINDLTDFTCADPSAGSTAPAATIYVNKKVDLSSGSAISVSFDTWGDVSLPGTYTTPFSTFYAARTTDTDFQNATFAEINNVLYIATGHNVLHKYDGTRVYKAGLPKATTPTAATSGAAGGSFTAGRILRYKIETQHTDAKGNIVQSEISDHVEVTVDGSGNSINVTYTELAAGSGYDTDGTLVYNIFRTDDSANATATSLYYLIKTATHGDSIPYDDQGDTEGAVYVDPVKQHGLPPSCRFIDEWRGQLIMSGDLTNATTVYYSDIDSPEYFPSAANSFVVDRKVTGIKTLDNILYVFKQHSIDGVSGSFADDNFTVNRVSREGVGCAAHNTIQEVQGRLFFLSDQGVFAISQEGMENIGSPIEPKFDLGNPFTFKQAIAYNNQRDKKYILLMPNLPVDASYSLNSTNEIYAFDYFRSAWLEWDNYNIMGGMTEINNVLYFNSRLVSEVLTMRVLQTQTELDYCDHISAISFSFKSHWITLGEPSLWKKFLRCKIHSYDTSVNDFELDAFSVTLKTEHDYNTSATRTNITYDFSGGSEGWGAGPWGNFPWGELRLPQLKKKLASKKSRSIRVIMENSTINENVLISGYELETVLPYKAALKE